MVGSGPERLIVVNVWDREPGRSKMIVSPYGSTPPKPTAWRSEMEGPSMIGPELWSPWLLTVMAIGPDSTAPMSTWLPRMRGRPAGRS